MAPNKYTWFLVFGLITLAIIVKPAYGNVGEIGQIKGSGVLERDGDIVIEGSAGVGVSTNMNVTTREDTFQQAFVQAFR